MNGQNGKRGLVLGGGGARGAYEIGIWRALRAFNWNPAVVCGTSVGAINGAIIAVGDYEVAERVWQELDTGMVFSIDHLDETLDIKSKTGIVLKKLAGDLVKNQAGDGSRLRALLETYIDEDALRRSAVEYGLATVQMNGLKLQELSRAEIPDGKLIDYILASAAIYPAVAPQKIDEKTFVDGGLFEQMPMTLATRLGAEDIIAVELFGAGLLHKKPADSVRVRVLRSRWDLGSQFVFDKKQIERNIALGFLDGAKLFGGFEGLYYAFEKGTLSPLCRTRHHKFNTLCEQAGLSFDRPFAKTAEKNAGAALKAVVTRRGYEDASYNNLLLCGGELCGEIFGLDPTVVYTEKSFLDALEDKVLGYALDVRRRLGPTAKPLSESFKLLSRELRTVILARLLSNPRLGEKPYSMIPAARLLPAEYLAALFIATVIHNDVYRKKEKTLLQGV